MREDSGLYRSDRQPDENGRHRMLVGVWLPQAERDSPAQYKARLQNAWQSCRLLCHQFIQLLFRRLRPALPLWNRCRLAFDIYIVRRHRIAALLWYQCPVRPDRVITNAKFFQANPLVCRIIIEMPVDFFFLERSVKPLQQAKLGRCAILNTYVRIQIFDMPMDSLGNKSRMIIGYQKNECSLIKM